MSQSRQDVQNQRDRVLPLLDLDVLRSFVTICETGSFSKAAALIFRTPSALSMQIKRLEETLGHSLFNRDSRKVTLTLEGEKLLMHSRRLLKLNQEVVSDFLTPAVEGTVRFGVVDILESAHLPEIMAQFANCYPTVHVDIYIGQSVDLVRRFNDNELDLIIYTQGCEGKPKEKGDVVFRERLVWAHNGSGNAYQQSPLPVALSNPGCMWRSAVTEVLDKAAIPYRIAYASENYVGQQAAMVADLAVAPYPESLVKPPLTQVAEEAGLPDLGYYQLELVSKGNSGPAIEALRTHVEVVLSK